MLKEIIVSKNGNKYIKKMSLEECIMFFEGAVKKWANETYSSLKLMSNNIMEYEDLYNEGMICLIKVYRKYIAINTFNTNLHKSLDNLRIDLMRIINTKKRKTELSVVSFEMEIEEGSEDADTLKDREGGIDENFSQMEFNEDLKKVFVKLTEEEKKIFHFLMENESTKRILAKDLKITRPTLDKRINKLKDKIIDYLPEYILPECILC